MKKTILWLVLAAAAGLGGCSSTAMQPNLQLEPSVGFDLVDPVKVDKAVYEKDYRSCSELANQDSVDLKRVAAGALGNVADKASFGLVGGGNTKDADRVTVLKRCLTGRGYNVLR